MKQKSVGLALGSGAVRGYAIIPVIKRLEKEKIGIEAVSGSSVGSLIGAYYALHGEIDSFFEQVKGMSRADFMKLIDPNNPKVSVFKGKKIHKFLGEKFFGDKTFKDTGISITICVTDPRDKKPVYLSQGKLVDAVMASISIPGLVPPFKIGRRLFIDGGVLDPVPTRPLLEAGLKKVVGINLTGFRHNSKKEAVTNFIPALMNSLYMMMKRLAEKEDDPRLFMLNPLFEPDPARMLAFHDWEESYEIGNKLISRKIGDLKKWLQS